VGRGVSRLREVGGLLGRRAVSGLGSVGASPKKKTWGQGWAKKKVLKKLFPGRKKKKNWARGKNLAGQNKEQKKKIIY
jgi:hypothetical protein